MMLPPFPQHKNDDEDELSEIFGMTSDISTRKQIEEKLQQSENWLQETTQMAKVGGWEIDLLGNTLSWTNETFRIHELSSKKVPNVEEAILFYHPEDRHIVSLAVDQSIKEGKDFDFEARLITAQKNTIWVRAIGHPVIKNSQALGVKGTIQDITAQKKVEEGLLKAKEQFEICVDGSNDGIWDWDLRTNTLFLSSKWKAQLGYKDSEIINEFSSFENLLFPEDNERVYAYLKEYLDGKIDLYSIEFRMKHKNGSLRWILARGKAIRNSQGIPLRMAGSHTDITEKKKAEEIINRNHQFQKMISEISSTFVKTNETSFDCDINEMLERLARHFYVDRSYMFLFSEDFKTMTNTHEWCAPHVSSQKEHLQNQATNSLPWMTKQIQLLDSIHIPNVHLLEEEASIEKQEFIRQEIKSLVCIPIRGSKQLWGLMGLDSVKKYCSWSDNEIDNLKTISNVVSDLLFRMHQIKEQKKLEISAFHSAKLASIGTLAAGLAHEINNPLAIAKGYLYLIKDDLKTNETSSEELQLKLKKIDMAFERIMNIINGLKVHVRPNTDTIENINLHHIIDETLSFCESIYFKYGIKVKKTLNAEMPLINGNAGKLKQVIMNLLANSKDALENCERDGEILIETYNKNKEIIIRFSDNGVGIKKDNIQKIFDPLFTTKDPGKGTGLGLSITFSIVKSFGGHIGVESQEGQGTTFIMNFPYL